MKVTVSSYIYLFYWYNYFRLKTCSGLCPSAWGMAVGIQLKDSYVEARETNIPGKGFLSTVL